MYTLSIVDTLRDVHVVNSDQTTLRDITVLQQQVYRNEDNE